jgi:hypothetical protein
MSLSYWSKVNDLAYISQTMVNFSFTNHFLHKIHKKSQNKFFLFFFLPSFLCSAVTNFPTNQNHPFLLPNKPFLLPNYPPNHHNNLFLPHSTTQSSTFNNHHHHPSTTSTIFNLQQSPKIGKLRTKRNWNWNTKLKQFGTTSSRKKRNGNNGVTAKLRKTEPKLQGTKPKSEVSQERR